MQAKNWDLMLNFTANAFIYRYIDKHYFVVFICMIENLNLQQIALQMINLHKKWPLKFHHKTISTTATNLSIEYYKT